MVCVDANIWVYYFDATLSEHEHVGPAVDELLESEPVFVTTVLQMEVIHYLSNQVADSNALCTQFLNAAAVTVTALTPADVSRASEILHTYANTSIGGRDASVLAAMERCGVDTLWTHDDAFETVASQLGITVVDPVVE